MKTFSVNSFCLLSVALATASLSANVNALDEFEAFRQQQMQGSERVRAEFRAYKEQQDQEFAGFLKNQWREFDTFRGRVRMAEPKPQQIPTVSPAQSRRSKLKIEPVAPPPVQLKPVVLSSNQLELSFYGNSIKLAFDERWKRYQMKGVARAEVFSDFWTQMSGTQYESTIQSVNAARVQLKLDDWAYVSLWRELTRALQPQRPAEQNLLLWFFLIKSGYDVRVGYASSDVYLWVAVQQAVYATKFTTVGNQTYYAVLEADQGDKIGRFSTYEANYPVRLKALDIHAASTAFTRTNTANRNLSFEYKGKTIQFSVPYDRSLVAYLSTFPQSDFELYFNTAASSPLRQALLQELRKLTNGMSETEAVNFLLSFVQKAFPYKTDDEQFGREKYFFVEESLHFQFNDCEDRSVLFAWLAHELVGVKTIGLLYPGHMTTAVMLKTAVPNAGTVEFQGQRFVIADPTYIGASLGMAMPSYANLKPTRIVDIQ
jgi:hypothetical protein